MPHNSWHRGEDVDGWDGLDDPHGLDCQATIFPTDCIPLLLLVFIVGLMSRATFAIFSPNYILPEQKHRDVQETLSWSSYTLDNRIHFQYRRRGRVLRMHIVDQC